MINAAVGVLFPQQVLSGTVYRSDTEEEITSSCESVTQQDQTWLYSLQKMAHV